MGIEPKVEIYSFFTVICINLVVYYGNMFFSGRAGLRKGDVITRINEKEVRLSSDIYGMIAAEEELRFTIHRGPDTLIISVIPEAVE